MIKAGDSSVNGKGSTGPWRFGPINRKMFISLIRFLGFPSSIRKVSYSREGVSLMLEMTYVATTLEICI